MDKNNKMELLGSTPIPKALMALGIPTMIGMLINSLYNLVDTYFVGGLGTDQMGAVTVAFPLGQIVVGLGLLFGNGAAAYLSRLLGRGDKDTANKVASTAIYSSVTIGAIIILLSVLFMEPILRQIGAIDSVMPYAIAYTRIYIVFSIFNVFNVTMNNITSSEGAAKTAMCALMAGGCPFYFGQDLSGNRSGRGCGQERSSALRSLRTGEYEKVSAKKSINTISAYPFFLLVYEGKHISEPLGQNVPKLGRHVRSAAPFPSPATSLLIAPNRGII